MRPEREPGGGAWVPGSRFLDRTVAAFVTVAAVLLVVVATVFVACAFGLTGAGVRFGSGVTTGSATSSDAASRRYAHSAPRSGTCRLGSRTAVATLGLARCD